MTDVKQPIKEAAYSALRKEERQKYEESLMYYNDLTNSLDTAFGEGKEKGIQESQQIIEKERGLKEEERRQKEEERRQKEEERGLKEEANKKLATKMKKYGENIEDIMLETGLNQEEIDNL